MRIHIVIRVKPGAYHTVFEDLQDKFIDSRINGLLGDYDIIFTRELRDENDYYDTIVKQVMTDGNIKPAQSFIVIKPMKKESQEQETAYIFINLIPGSGEYVQQRLLAYTEVLSADIVSGNFDMIAQVSIKNVHQLWRFLGEVAHIQGVCRTVTHLVPEAFSR